jgi:hypothetical protein
MIVVVDAGAPKAIDGADAPDGAVAAEIDVRLLVDRDALGLRACLERCYGDTSPRRVLYRPEETAALFSSKGYVGVVAVAEDVIVLRPRGTPASAWVRKVNRPL